MSTASTEIGAARAPSGATAGSAFGVALEADFAIPGLVPGSDPIATPVRLRLARRSDLLAGWRPENPQRISTRRLPNGRAAVAIDADDGAGYLIRAMGFGCFWVSPDAHDVLCAPVRAPAWRWQRYLVGQVLPLLAVLHGFEVFHASAVAGPEGAAAFIGMSTAGKTSIAANLALRGYPFMADDVVALGLEPDGAVVAHPGPGLISLRHGADAFLQREDRERLGRPLGRDDDAVRILVEAHGRPRPLRHVFVLERRPSGDGGLTPLEPVDPRLLLGGSFNFIIRTPERLINQLDLCSRVARDAAVYRALITPGLPPDALAALVAERIGAPLS